MLVLFALQLTLMAVVMQRFGGIPWSLDLIQLNWGWAALLPCGLVFLGLAAALFLRARSRAISN
jgi:hypothetical protein